MFDCLKKRQKKKQHQRFDERGIRAELKKRGIDLNVNPLVVVMIRGYKLGMGKPDVNDRGIYDDCAIIVSPTTCTKFTGNADPSRYRKGYGYGRHKGMASLVPGLYKAHVFDIHGGSVPHPAICQRIDDVTVLRDGNPPYKHQGMFGINFHRGGWEGTSSAGCMTVIGSEWDDCYELAMREAKRHDGPLVEKVWHEGEHKILIPLVLIEA